LIRFGKPSGPLLAQKGSFFSNNDELQEKVKRICAIYAKQESRNACKNCTSPISGTTFSKLGVEYSLCANCGHLNGRHEDTDEFCRAVYTDDGGAAYAITYSSSDRSAYESRVRAIYVPKAEFLFEVLGTKNLRFADMGAGSGYFVAALLQGGATDVVGYEVSETQLALARQMSGGEFVLHSLDAISDVVSTVNAEVISFIGVLEHLRNPREALAAVRTNPSIKHIYFSVPMFSPTVCLEAVFPDVFHRHLSAGHTHLYTESSIDWFCKEFGFKRVGEWWFGTDIVDLYRDVIVSLQKKKEVAGLADTWHKTFCETIDSLQLELDKRKLSSEVHMVLSK